MHEEIFLSSWVDGRWKKVKAKREMEVNKEKTEEKKENESGRKGEDETVVKRKCVNPVSVEAFVIFSYGEISECVSCGVDSDCESGTWSSALVSNDIRVPTSFAVEVVGGGEPSDSGRELGSKCGSVAASGVLVVTDVSEIAPSVVTLM